MTLARFCLAAVFGSTLLNYFVSLTDAQWDWDINHMMYFGQRLLAGELHWTVEFDDKLPVNQFLFFIPAALDSFRVWQGLSLIAMAGGAWAVWWIIRELLRPLPQLPGQIVGLCTQIGAVATLAGFAFSPGGITHINPLAASAGIGAIALLMAAFRTGRDGEKPRIWLFVLSAVCASIAIGIRPYFLLALCASAFWVTLRCRTSSQGRVVAVISAAAWVATVGLMGVLTNVLPYVLIGEMQVFWDGLSVLRQELIPQSVLSVVREQHSQFTDIMLPVFPMITLASVSISAVALFGLLTRRGRADALKEEGVAGLWRDVVVVAVLLPVLIEIMILSKHFWPHYMQMFVPFLAVGAGIFAAQLWRGSLQAPHNAGVLKTAIVLLVLVPLWRITLDQAKWVAGGEKYITELDNLSQQIARFLETQPEGARDFLVPRLMYEHWRLGEPRHGFVHAANTDFITPKNWWADIASPESFELPRNLQEYCSMIDRKGPSVLVSSEAGGIRDCLRSSAVYTLSDFRSPASEDVVMFLRRAGQ
ncbi:hypothetical protein [uncultured Roseobacter sp.]|uniref:hypothetical protein n=1 Tax=uncultured Roseobacter sp. TaxID=114847 RepID=UPI0026069035|nr:hypothetical protein [uncultured Roseobacter sp.]